MRTLCTPAQRKAYLLSLSAEFEEFSVHISSNPGGWAYGLTSDQALCSAHRLRSMLQRQFPGLYVIISSAHTSYPFGGRGGDNSNAEVLRKIDDFMHECACTITKQLNITHLK